MSIALHHRRARAQRTLAAAALAWLALAALPAAAADFDPAAAPEALAAAFIKSERLAALANVKRVAISQFRVEFAVENEAKAQSSGTSSWTSTQTNIKLVGVGDDTRQAIADQLHERLLQQLAATGLEVVPAATLRANAAYQSLGPVLRTKAENLGTRVGKSVFLGAAGLPWYLSNDDRHIGLGATLGSFSTTQSQNIEPEIAKTLDAAVMRVTMRLTFAEQSTSGGIFRIGSSVKTTARLALVPGETQWLVVTPDGRSRIYLDQLVSIGDGALEMVETTDDKGVQAVANVVTGLLAGGGRSRASYEARTTPQAYQAELLRYGQATQSALLAAMRPGLKVTPPAAAPAPATATPNPTAAAPAATAAAPAAPASAAQ